MKLSSCGVENSADNPPLNMPRAPDGTTIPTASPCGWQVAESKVDPASGKQMNSAAAPSATASMSKTSTQPSSTNSDSIPITSRIFTMGSIRNWSASKEQTPYPRSLPEPGHKSQSRRLLCPPVRSTQCSGRQRVSHGLISGPVTTHAAASPFVPRNITLTIQRSIEFSSEENLPEASPCEKFHKQ